MFVFNGIFGNFSMSEGKAIPEAHPGTHAVRNFLASKPQLLIPATTAATGPALVVRSTAPD